MTDSIGHTLVFGPTGAGKASFGPALQFEFHAYAGDEFGAVAERAAITTGRMATHNAARARAGRMAKRIKGPVDLALAGAAPWNERYITTASPSDYHAAGYRFERIT
nr:hypothetical protein [Pseudomonas oleovorans]